MRVPFYDIKAQYTELAPELDRVTHEVISSGVYNLGPHHDALEREIADLHGCKYGIGLNSGTDALRILMDCIGVGPGDEVITTAFTFVASVETIVQTGAKPVFVDIDPFDFNIDPSLVEAAITPRTKAILPIHLFGQLCQIDRVKSIADSRGLKVIEDSAQAVGCTLNGVSTGNFGVGAAFSFYVTKNLGAAGDAGMIVTNDEEIVAGAKSRRIHGMGRERYYYDHLGYTSRLHEIQAAVLRVKLTRLEAWNNRRAEIASLYSELLQELPISLPQTRVGNNNTHHQYSILTDRRDELQAFLKSREIDSMIYYPVPIHFHEPYREFGGGEGSLPQTERVCREILNLPIHPHLSDDQVRHAANSIREFFNQ